MGQVKTIILKLLISLILVVAVLGIFAPSPAYAQRKEDTREVKYSLSQSLRPDGQGPYRDNVIMAWRVMLSLANIVVVLLLLFIAAVNILHINYDTYQLKQTLPKLIFGVVMANFSLLICRMVIDLANVLTRTFVGPNITTAILEPLVYNLGLPGIATTAGTIGGAVFLVIPGLQAVSIGALLLALVVVCLPVIGVAVLLFLLFIRIAVVLALAVVSPVAFISIAFPPTEKFFKMWWDWFLKWVFMKPVMVFLLWLAVLIGHKPKGADESDISLTSWIMTVGLTYAAFIVPFKFGGAVMAGWARLGQWATGIGKGGYLRKPAEEWWGRKKDITKGAFTSSIGNNALGRYLDRGLKTDEALQELYKNRRENQLTNATRDVKDRLRGEGYDVDAEAAETELNKDRLQRTTKTRKQRRLLTLYQGDQREELINEEVEEMIATGQLEREKRQRTLEIYRSERGYELSEFEGDIATAEMALNKTKEDKRYINAAEKLARYNNLQATNPALFNALRERDAARERVSNTRAGSAERAAADAALATAHANLTAAGAAAGIVIPDAAAYRHADFMSRVERTRQFAIINPRAHDDAKDGASSQTPQQAAADLRNINGFDMGPNHAEAGDNVRFFNGQNLSSHQAALAVMSKVGQIAEDLKNRSTAGAAMQGYAEMIRDAGGNAEIEMNGAIQEVLRGMEPARQTDILSHINNVRVARGQAALASAADITAEHLQDVRFNTAGDLGHQEFVNQMAIEMLRRDERGTFRSGLNGNLANYI